MRRTAILVCWAALAVGANAAQAQSAAAKAPQGAAHVTLPPAPKALLPESFAGWVATGAPRKVSDAAQADPDNAAVLKEYEFTDATLAGYKRSGETLSLRALRFHDASGAYGAFSFYRQNGWPKEQIGAGAGRISGQERAVPFAHGGSDRALPGGLRRVDPGNRPRRY